MFVHGARSAEMLNITGCCLLLSSPSSCYRGQQPLDTKLPYLSLASVIITAPFTSPLHATRMSD